MGHAGRKKGESPGVIKKKVRIWQYLIGEIDTGYEREAPRKRSIKSITVKALLKRGSWENQNL